jgi:hypothetical protein
LFRIGEFAQAVEVYQAGLRGVQYMNCAPPPRFAIWLIDGFGSVTALFVAALISAASMMWS